MEPDRATTAGALPARFAAAILLAAALAGAIGGFGGHRLAERWLETDATTQPPVIILSVADALLAGRDAGQIRGLAERLGDGGFVVLDAQAVLAAPDALYLPFGNGAQR